MIFSNLRVIFGILGKSSEVFRWYWEIILINVWAIFGNLQKYLGDLQKINVQKSSNYLWLSLEGFGSLGNLNHFWNTSDGCRLGSLSFFVLTSDNFRCNFHWCYNFALVLHFSALMVQERCTPILANQNSVIFSSVLLHKYVPFCSIITVTYCNYNIYP